MVEAEMTKDIRDYEAKWFGLVTMRQMILLLIGAAYSIPLALIVPGDFSIKIMAGAIGMAPVILLGWVSVYGMRLEQFALQFLRSTVLAPTKRKYKVQSSTQYLDAEFLKEAPQKRKKAKPSEKYPAHK